MIVCEAVDFDDELFDATFPHISGLEAAEYLEAIDNKKVQAFSLQLDGKISHMLTSVSLRHGVKYLNILELCGDFGYASHPKEFLEMVTNMGKAANADELRVMVTRGGGAKILRDHQFELKYSEYGLNLK